LQDVALTISSYASSLDIMLEAPIGSARYNNEFGRPALTGVFRTLLTDVDNDWRGYHKPIMLAGGLGSVRPQHALKSPEDVHEGAHVVVLGGPAMLIGLGGGAASSSNSSEATAELDFNSVQRGNPEVERRVQVCSIICTRMTIWCKSSTAFQLSNIMVISFGCCAFVNTTLDGHQHLCCSRRGKPDRYDS
jgi:phosphoribosylformylglycinamidine synthase